MQKIIIDEQFKFLLPPLDEKSYRDLEKGILEHGVLYPLILWNDILIDGYNRYNICIEHGLPFETIDMEFDSRDDVEIWIIENQVGRRNLTPMQLSYLRGMHYLADMKSRGGDRKSDEAKSKSQNATLISGSTSKQLSDKYNVSRDTILRDRKLAESLIKIGEISPEAKMKILSEEMPINKSKLEALSSAPPEMLKTVATEIEEGTYNRRALSTAKREEISEIMINFSEVQKLNSIINSFAKDINTLVQKMKTGNPTEFKSTLRSYIDELEELYSKV